MSILQKIKSGKNNYKLVDFPGTDEKIAIVILSSSQTEICKLKTEEYIVKHIITDETYKDMVLQRHLSYEFMRDKDDRNKKVVDNVDEVGELLDISELAYMVTQYNLFSQENSPFLNAVNTEQFEALKKTLPTMNLNDLNGESLVALRNFLMSLV